MGPPCQPLLKRQALSLVRDGQTETEREREENGEGLAGAAICSPGPWDHGRSPPHPTPSGPWGPASSCSSRGGTPPGGDEANAGLGPLAPVQEDFIRVVPGSPRPCTKGDTTNVSLPAVPGLRGPTVSSERRCGEHIHT